MFCKVQLMLCAAACSLVGSARRSREACCLCTLHNHFTVLLLPREEGVLWLEKVEKYHATMCQDTVEN